MLTKLYADCQTFAETEIRILLQALAPRLNSKNQVSSFGENSELG